MANNDELKYWIALSRIPGIGKAKISYLKKHFGNLADAWKAPEGELRYAGLDSQSASAFVCARSEISPEDELSNLERHKIKAFMPEDEDYPARLKEIHDYPPVLYVKGELPAEDEFCLAVVGTRRPSSYGCRVTEEIVSALVQNKATIVSGLARGIDSIAHRSALENGGRTIAVFACGLDIVYPAENSHLACSIAEKGALVSEYPPGVRPRAGNFPLRNRIMSGMSRGVLVIEAREKSGALITAFQALEQDREVFAVPGSIFSPGSKGTNRLIQEGAKLVDKCSDIMEEFNLTTVPRQVALEEFVPTNENEVILLKQLTYEPSHIDEICRLSNLDVSQVSSALAMLEINGRIKQVGNMNYVLIDKVKIG